MPLLPSLQARLRHAERVDQLAGMRADLGDASPGKFADLIAVEGDPLADIQVVITKVRGVMKGGVVVVTR